MKIVSQMKNSILHFIIFALKRSHLKTEDITGMGAIGFALKNAQI